MSREERIFVQSRGIIKIKQTKTRISQRMWLLSLVRDCRLDNAAKFFAEITNQHETKPSCCCVEELLAVEDQTH